MSGSRTGIKRADGLGECKQWSCNPPVEVWQKLLKIQLEAEKKTGKREAKWVHLERAFDCWAKAGFPQ